ncbi:efflux RND transporter permease subunit [Pseudoroseomonas cervicalis]|uniref:efflux RND transporter permease subunit n=1 Tax=Teichococcus cervicalis TaxID=204525 RepID=UPI0022F1A766|nr:efflux RND transporter permease subunit [Pseudoroseomonas cervicalis]WBV44392.1 efflux RND transporter permease subunit [Pseudoroseomonas cervicalis]
MNISAPFVRRPIATLLLALGLALAGLVALRDLPVSAMPRVDLPTIFVSVNQPGANPETLAATVIAPLERQIGAIAGITEMTSSAGTGSGNIIIQFDLSRTQESAARDVQAAVNAARQDLPAGLPNPPSVRKINPADAPVLILAMTAETLPRASLYDVADSIVAQRLAQIDGVAQVQVAGTAKPAVRVSVDPAAAAAAGVSFDAIRTAITAANVTQPVGLIDGEEQAASIAVNDRLGRAPQYESVVVQAQDGAVLRLSRIARISEGAASSRQMAWFDQREATLMLVFKQADANVIDVVNGVKEMLPQLQRWVPGGVRIDVMSDRSGTIRASVEEVEFTLLLTIALVVAVVAVFLRRLAPVVAASVTVPLSLLGTLFVIWMLGYSLNNFSLMALTISVGFVVDDAIVMLENMARMRARGMAVMQAALEGARQIGFTIISITVSLIAVFVPLLAMGGIVGRFFREFSATLAIAVTLSAVLSLTLTPMLAARMEREGEERPPGRLARGFERGLDAILGAYLRSLRFVLHFRRTALLASLSLIGVTIWLYVIVPKGFFPEQDTGLLAGSARAAPDTSFARMSDIMEQATRIILRDPAVDSVGAQIGGGFGGAGTNTGQFYITLKPREQRELSAAQVIDRLRAPLSRIAGASVFLRAQQDLFVGGRPGDSQYSYVLLGSDLEALREASNQMVEALRVTPGFFDVSSDQERGGLVNRVVVDRDQAARLGISMQALGAALNNAFAQRQVSTIYATRNQYNVVLEIDPALQQDATQLARIFLPGRNNAQVPLSAVARIERDMSPLRVTHRNQFPAATISFNLPVGTSLGEAQARVREVELGLDLPAGIRSEYGGNAAAFQAFSRDQPLLILAAILSIYIVLGVLYESYIHPLTILSTLPTAGIGALLALLVTGLPFSVIALIGVILLMGIVKKNAIMMVDFALEHAREEGADAEASILAACRDRFRPILMTTLAALFGAVPLAFGTGTGAEMRQPLGITIIGGMVVSQLLTLYTTPVIYLALERLRQRHAARRETVPAR